MSGDRYIIGCDPGQAVDPTAICAVRLRPGGVCQVGHLERLPLGTTYPGVIAHVRRLMAHEPFAKSSELVLDLTGIGRPVADMFVDAGLHPIKVVITGGDAETNENGIYRVPKLNLVSRVQSLLHADKLKVQADLPDAPILRSELQDFEAQVSDQGRWKFGARVGKHDDLVLAIALACWRAIKTSSKILLNDKGLRRSASMPPRNRFAQFQPGARSTRNIFARNR